MSDNRFADINTVPELNAALRAALYKLVAALNDMTLTWNDYDAQTSAVDDDYDARIQQLWKAQQKAIDREMVAAAVQLGYSADDFWPPRKIAVLMETYTATHKDASTLDLNELAQVLSDAADAWSRLKDEQ